MAGMAKKISTTRDILDALPAVQEAVREEIRARIDAGENIVFANHDSLLNYRGLNISLASRRSSMAGVSDGDSKDDDTEHKSVA